MFFPCDHIYLNCSIPFGHGRRSRDGRQETGSPREPGPYSSLKGKHTFTIRACNLNLSHTLVSALGRGRGWGGFLNCDYYILKPGSNRQRTEKQLEEILDRARCHSILLFSHTSTFQFMDNKPWSQVGVVPPPPRILPSVYIAHRVQRSLCSSIFYRMLLTHALAFSAPQVNMCARKNSHDFIRVRTRGDSNPRN